MIGQTISHYKILEKLGEGGMGVVYKAEDTKLDRFVALKFLPPHLAASEQDKARFVQEAKAAAALNHPNVCSIIDIQEHDDQMFIVMEFVDGQTLREKGTSINFKQAIDIGIQIADGLAAAHEKGIVHRDIKPENIMIRKDGIAQIMDFGLAKLRASGSKITRLTKEGSTVGTAGYMSPEQVQGQDTDHRSDIFSYGVLLYELLTGQLPFRGVHETALAYEIVNVDPAPMSSVKPDIDPNLDTVVLECLEKDSRERTQSIAQTALDLKRYRRESSRQKMSRITAARPAINARPTAEMATVPPRAWKANIGYMLSGILIIAVIVLIIFPVKKDSVSDQLALRYTIELPEKIPLLVTQGGLAFSPDSKVLAYVASSQNSRQLYLHKMDQLTFDPIPGTENAWDPAFSPDGQWIAFASGGKIVKTSVYGGSPEVLCNFQGQTRGVSWVTENAIMFGQIGNGIARISAAGGNPELITTIDSTAGEISHRFPQLLPDGKSIIFTVKNSTITSFDEAMVVAQRLGTGERKVLVRGGTYGRYMPSGYLTFIRGTTIYAVPFDPDRLEVKGPQIPVEDGVFMFQGSGHADFEIARNGLMIFAPTGSFTTNSISMAWMDRKGNLTPLLDTLRPYQAARLSPDGQKIAAGINAANNDIWVYQIQRGVLTRLTFAGGNHGNSIWSPDGKYIVYTAEKGKSANLFRKLWDGSLPEERLTSSTNVQNATDFTPDGKNLAYIENGDVWILPLDGSGPNGEKKPWPFIQSPATEKGGVFSTDGRWMAYISDESGKNEVYVTGFPHHEGKWQVSIGGGAGCAWSRNGKELFYVNESSLMAIDVRPGSSFDYSVPHKVCEIPRSADVQDVSPDGNHFLVMVSQTQLLALPRLEVVTNWFDVLRTKIAGSKN